MRPGRVSRLDWYLPPIIVDMKKKKKKTSEFITLNAMSVSVIDLHIHTPLVNCVRYGLNGGCLYQVWLWYEHESNPR